MKRISLITFTLILFSMSAFTQNYGVLKGRIVDENNLPLPGANLSINSLNIGTTSDFNGFFTILKVNEGTFELEVSFIGYESKQTEITIETSKTTTYNFQLKPGVLLDEVSIGLQTQGQAKALNQQKSATGVSNIIASDQVGKFPDDNIGDALKRVPGINVQYDQGEARFANVRGTEPRLNSVSVNGERIPSAEGEIRAVQLDLIPSDMIQTVEVTKTLTPDMDADAIGGAINLVTRSAPKSTRFSGTLGTGYNPISEKITYNGSVVLATRFADDKFGLVFSGSYFDNPVASDNIEAEWDLDDNDNAFTTDFQVRQYKLQRIRKSFSLALDYKINENHKLIINGIYNHRNDWENRYRRRYKDIELDEDSGKWITEIRRQTKAGADDDKYARLEDQKTFSSNFGGEHLLGNWKLDWSTSYAKASEERPKERYISYRAKKVEVIPDLSDPRHPKYIIVDSDFDDLSPEFGLKELTEENKYTDEKDLNAKINLEIPISTGKYQNSIKIGARYRGKDKERDNDFYEFEPLDEDAFDAVTLSNQSDQTKKDYRAGNYQIGHFVSKNYLGQLNLNNSSAFEKSIVNEELAGNYTATEDITAAFLMFTQNIGEKIVATAGFRFESTSIESQGFAYDADDDLLVKTPTAKDDYSNFLPNLQLKYSFNPTNILRFAYTNTLARPNYFDLVPYKEIYREDNEIKIGNSNLEPTTSINFDLMFEHYFKNVGILSGGIFYKDISDFIVEIEKRDYNFEGHTWDKFNQPINGGDANITGLEFAFQKNLDFLPGALKGVGVYLNYTYTHSEVDNFEIDGRENESIALPGTPSNNLNASLSYEYKNFFFRISSNWTDAYRDSEGIGESKFYDSWYDSSFHLDINAYYVFGKEKQWKVYFDANNLTDQPLRFYQGIEERTLQAEYYGANYSLGVKFDLFLNK